MPASPHPRPRLRSPATERNREPILQVLRGALPVTALVLEIASGTGQHSAYFGAAMPGWQWQPTDVDEAALPSIDAWCDGIANVRPGVRLDVMQTPWPLDGPFDAVFCANMLHISPWATCAALMAGAASVLGPSGVLVTYGPYLQAGVETSQGNLAFDASLRARDPQWGIRSVEDVAREAEGCGLRLERIVPMPANNLSLVWSAGHGGSAAKAANASA